MKNCLFFITLLIFHCSKAQESTFGIKAGANFSTIYGDFTEGFQPRLGFQLGGLVHIDVNREFYVQPEVFYSSQGYVFDTDLPNINPDGPALGTDIKSNVQNNFLAVPLIIGFKLNRNLAIEAGPHFAFLLNQVVKVKEDTNITDEQKSSGDFRLDYGLALGLSYAFGDHFSVQPRMYLGVANNLRNDVLNNFQNRNLSFQLSVVYTFKER